VDKRKISSKISLGTLERQFRGASMLLLQVVGAREVAGAMLMTLSFIVSNGGRDSSSVKILAFVAKELRDSRGRGYEVEYCDDASFAPFIQIFSTWPRQTPSLASGQTKVQRSKSELGTLSTMAKRIRQIGTSPL
jgi:hypothetical protein